MVKRCERGVDNGQHDHSISTQHIRHNIVRHINHVAHVWPTCWDVLRLAVTCWVLLAKGWKWSNFYETFVDVSCCYSCSHLARIVQQCWTWVYALVYLSISNMSQHLATACPNACNLFAPNFVAICCIQMLWLFGHSLKVLDQQFCNGSVEMLRSFGMGFIYTKRDPIFYCHFLWIFLPFTSKFIFLHVHALCFMNMKHYMYFSPAYIIKRDSNLLVTFNFCFMWWL